MALKHSFSLYSELFIINLLLWFMFQNLWAASLLPNKTVSSVKSDTGPDFSVLTLGMWRRKWQPTPVFLPGESRGQRSLVGYSPWCRKNQAHLSD